MIATLLFTACTAVDAGDQGFLVVGAFVHSSFTYEGLQLGEGGALTSNEWASDTALGLSDHLDRCGENNAYLRAWADATEVLLAASDDGEDAATVCEQMPAFLSALSDAGNAQAARGSVLSMSLCQSCDALEGTVALGSDEAPYALLRVDSDPTPQELADRWDADACAIVEAEPSVGEDSWMLEAGTLELHVSPFGGYDGVLDAGPAEPLTDGVDPIATVQATFSAAACPPPEVDRLLMWTW